MPKYWMINIRDKGGVGTSPNTGGLTYWVTDKTPLNVIGNWMSVTADKLQTLPAGGHGDLPALA